jgi:hypothetical protein
MPSILNSDDGVVSGTSGLKSTGGNDGLLNIQSNGSTVLAVTGSGIAVTGTMSQTGASTFAAGTAGAPSITFTGDTNTGIFSPAADTIAFAEGGAEAGRFNSNGQLLIGTTTAPSVSTIRNLIANGSGAYYQFTKTDATAGGGAIGTDGSEVLTYTHTGAVGSETYTAVTRVAKDKSLALQGATPQTGTGITFPATQSASTDANTLDDYEEGTWTPTANNVTVNSGSPTYSGVYTKVGNIVYFQFQQSGGNITISGSTFFGGLPFNVPKTSPGAWSDAGTNKSGLQYAYEGSANVYITEAISTFTNLTGFMVSGVYRV